MAGARSQGSTPATLCGPVDIVQRETFEKLKVKSGKKRNSRIAKL